MPFYRVKLQQGKRTVTEHIEAKSLTSLLTFFEYVTTMKVAEVLKVEYLNPSDIIPIDDFNYDSLFKTFAVNDVTNTSRQFILHNIKKTVTDDELFNKIFECLEVSGGSIASCHSTLRKM